MDNRALFPNFRSRGLPGSRDGAHRDLRTVRLAACRWNRTSHRNPWKLTLRTTEASARDRTRDEPIRKSPLLSSGHRHSESYPGRSPPWADPDLSPHSLKPRLHEGPAGESTDGSPDGVSPATGFCLVRNSKRDSSVPTGPLTPSPEEPDARQLLILPAHETSPPWGPSSAAAPRAGNPHSQTQPSRSHVLTSRALTSRALTSRALTSRALTSCLSASAAGKVPLSLVATVASLWLTAVLQSGPLSGVARNSCGGAGPVSIPRVRKRAWVRSWPERGEVQLLQDSHATGSTFWPRGPNDKANRGRHCGK
jgi:hypothetical protein